MWTNLYWKSNIESWCLSIRAFYTASIAWQDSFVRFRFTKTLSKLFLVVMLNKTTHDEFIFGYKTAVLHENGPCLQNGDFRACYNKIPKSVRCWKLFNKQCIGAARENSHSDRDVGPLSRLPEQCRTTRCSRSMKIHNVPSKYCVLFVRTWICSKSTKVLLKETISLWWGYEPLSERQKFNFQES